MLHCRFVCSPVNVARRFGCTSTFGTQVRLVPRSCGHSTCPDTSPAGPISPSRDRPGSLTRGPTPICQRFPSSHFASILGSYSRPDSRTSTAWSVRNPCRVEPHPLHETVRSPRYPGLALKETSSDTTGTPVLTLEVGRRPVTRPGTLLGPVVRFDTTRSVGREGARYHGAVGCGGRRVRRTTFVDEDEPTSDGTATNTQTELTRRAGPHLIERWRFTRRSRQSRGSSVHSLGVSLTPSEAPRV